MLVDIRLGSTGDERISNVGCQRMYLKGRDSVHNHNDAGTRVSEVQTGFRLRSVARFIAGH